MAEESQKEVQTEATEASPAAAGKSGLIKYILFGVGGIVVIVGVAFAALLFMGGEPAETPVEPEETVAQVETPDTTHSDMPDLDDPAVLDSLLAEGTDDDVLAQIMENLAVLDFNPDEGVLPDDEMGMSVEDSLEAENWLAQEKKRLAAWEDSVAAREKQLNRLSQQVNKKILRIEQAESAKVASLARLYDGMDSRAVARLMSNLDNATVVSILPRMKAKNASAVLQLLPAQRAATLSKQMITIAEK